jgi:hypothetical protein
MVERTVAAARARHRNSNDVKQNTSTATSPRYLSSNATLNGAKAAIINEPTKSGTIMPGITRAPIQAA